MREAGWEADRPGLGGGLGGGLELDLTADGAPANPLVVLDLERWRGATNEEIGRAAGLVAAALPITVGVLRGPLTPGLEPLVAAATLTLADGRTVMTLRTGGKAVGATRPAVRRPWYPLRAVMMAAALMAWPAAGFAPCPNAPGG